MQCLNLKTSLRVGSIKAKVPRAARPVVRAEAATESETSVEAAERKKKASPLERGGTLSGAAAAGKDAGARALASVGVVSAPVTRMQVVDGRFRDDRWVDGCWDFTKFKKANGETDWDAVIDAEIARRRLLEESPIPSINEDPVNFDTSMVPWWVWMKRFHLPEAEKINGRAAMVGYVLALLVDKLTGVGLVDQQESFFGKLLLHVTVFALFFVRNTSDLDKLKGLADEAVLYDKQWNASWEGFNREQLSEKAK